MTAAPAADIPSTSVSAHATAVQPPSPSTSPRHLNQYQLQSQHAVSSKLDPGPGGKSGVIAQASRYQMLRQRLDTLGYRDPFGADSAELIVRLLNDLIQTTESCRQFKQQWDQERQEKRYLDSKLEPLQQQLSQLTHDNNQLHLDLIHAADQRDERDRKAQLALKKQQNELADLHFLNKQLQKRIETEQRRAEAERFRLEHILQLLGSTVGKELDVHFISKAQSMPLNKLGLLVPQMELRGGTDASLVIPPALPIPAPAMELDPTIGDMLRITESKLRQLEQGHSDLKAKNMDLHHEIDGLKEQVRSRENEIARLASLLEAERSYVSGHRSASLPTDYAAHDSEFVKQSRVDQLEMQIDFLHQSQEELEKQIAKLEKEKAILDSDWRQQTTKLRGELDQAHARNKNLCKDLKSLEAMLFDLEKAHKAMLNKPNGQRKLVAAIQSNMKALKKSTAESLQNSSLNHHDTKSDSSGNQKDSTTAHVKPIVDSTLILEELHRLRKDFLMVSRELQETRARLNDASGVVNTPTEHNNMTADVMERIVAENNQLHVKLQSLQSTSPNNAGGSDPSSLQELEQARKVIQSLRAELSHQSTEMESFRQKCSELERSNVSLERRENELTMEMQGLKQKELQLSETLRKRTLDLEAVRAELESSRNELDNLNKGKIDLASVQVAQRDGQPVQLRQSMVAASIQTESGQTESGQTDLVLELENRCNDLRSQLETATMERDTALDQLQAVRQSLETKEQYLAMLQDEQLSRSRPYAKDQQTVDELRRLIADADRDRDRWQHELDEKAERLIELESVIRMFRDRDASGLGEVKALQEQLEALGKRIQEKEQAIEGMRRETEELMRQNNVLKEESMKKAEMANQYSSDIGNVLRENQTLNQQLMAVKQDRDSIKDNLVAVSEQAKYFEQLVLTREEEKEQIMSTYRRLMEQHGKVQENLHRAMEDRKRIEMDVSAQLDRVRQLTEEKELIRTELAQCRHDKEHFKLQCSTLSQSVESFHADLEQREKDNRSLQNEVEAIRSLLSELQRSKDILQGQLVERISETEHTKHFNAKYENDIQQLRSQLEHERTRAGNFERLVEEERNRAMRIQLSLEEKILNRTNNASDKITGDLSQELLRTERKIVRLQERIRLLEKTVSDQNEALKQSDEDRLQLHLALRQLKGYSNSDISNMTPSVQRTTQDVHKGDVSSPDHLEQRLMLEVEETKNMVRKWERLVRQRSEVEATIESHAGPSRTELVSVTSSKSMPSPNADRGQMSSLSPSIDVSRGRGDDTADETNIARELLATWKAQNEAIRRELLTTSKSTFRASQDIEKATRTEAVQTAPTANRPNTAVVRENLSRSEMRRRQLEEENRLILDVVHQVAEELKTKSPPPG